jgi:hypothetical protein
MFLKQFWEILAKLKEFHQEKSSFFPGGKKEYFS